MGGKLLVVLRYVLFAVLATLANLLTQRLVLGLGDNNAVFAVAVVLGTLVGLALKYMLDKRWIFHDYSSGVREQSKKFTLYTTMGIATTAIFWGTETVFWFIWKTGLMRELGAIIGLSIGYVVKFYLDRRFVFIGSKLGGVT
jgi:putative flippase GtrA